MELLIKVVFTLTCIAVLIDAKTLVRDKRHLPYQHKLTLSQKTNLFDNSEMGYLENTALRQKRDTSMPSVLVRRKRQNAAIEVALNGVYDELNRLQYMVQKSRPHCKSIGCNTLEDFIGGYKGGYK